jgi:hypothetical protein
MLEIADATRPRSCLAGRLQTLGECPRQSHAGRTYIKATGAASGLTGARRLKGKEKGRRSGPKLNQRTVLDAAGFQILVQRYDEVQS